jgi:hypothetical protein
MKTVLLATAVAATVIAVLPITAHGQTQTIGVDDIAGMNDAAANNAVRYGIAPTAARPSSGP